MEILKDIVSWFTEAWDLFKMGELVTDMGPSLSQEAVFQSLWLPLGIILLALFFFYLKRPIFAAVLLTGLGLFYVISIYLPTLNSSLTSVANFAIAFIAISAISIYFVFIREE